MPHQDRFHRFHEHAVPHFYDTVDTHKVCTYVCMYVFMYMYVHNMSSRVHTVCTYIQKTKTDDVFWM